MRGSVAPRHLRKSMRGDDGSNSNHGIVSEVEKETREHRAGPGAGEGENNPDENEQADQPPIPSELGGVHEPEEEAGQQDTEDHAGADGAWTFDT